MEGVLSPAGTCGASRGAGWTDRDWAAASLPDACFLGLPTVVKLVDRETLLREREEKKRVSTTRLGCAANS